MYVHTCAAARVLSKACRSQTKICMSVMPMIDGTHQPSLDNNNFSDDGDYDSKTPSSIDMTETNASVCFWTRNRQRRRIPNSCFDGFMVRRACAT